MSKERELVDRIEELKNDHDGRLCACFRLFAFRLEKLSGKNITYEDIFFYNSSYRFNYYEEKAAKEKVDKVYRKLMGRFIYKTYSKRRDPHELFAFILRIPIYKKFKVFSLENLIRFVFNNNHRLVPRRS